jgi:SAM-dependent methyltransferase
VSPGDPLSPGEREELELDLISTADRELDLLGDIRSLRVLYAGGASLLWLEGLSQRIGPAGSLTALEADASRVREARETLHEADLSSCVRVVGGDVFDPPFPPGSFDLAYSAGLFHELDVVRRSARDALAAIVGTVRPGGRVATSDFVDAIPAAQLEDEEIQGEVAFLRAGTKPYGIGPPERLVGLHRALLEDVRSKVSEPAGIRHLHRLVLAEDPLIDLGDPDSRAARLLRERHERLLERVRREGYSRPATLYVEGAVPRG